MNRFVVFTILPLLAYPQYDDIGIDNELDDPDETQYVEQLMERIFEPFSIETADSTALGKHGYSQESVELILGWQESGENLTSLKKRIQGNDLILLKKDIKQGSQKTQIQMRQRLQYSPSLKGWRILNKGHLRGSRGSISLLSEQDPGESNLTDHSIISLSSQSLPWCDYLILGDFQVKWGGGLNLRQQGSRLSLNPGSLLQRGLSTIRPHYSSREIDYFRGIASCFSFAAIKGTAFISNRSIEGSMHGGEFKVDGDGIHPTGKNLVFRPSQHTGLALEMTTSGLHIYGSTIYNGPEQSKLAYEVGFSNELSASHRIQVFTNSLDVRNHRTMGTWAYFSPTLQVSLQYRHFVSSGALTQGSISTLLGASASNEKGISVRTQLRPRQKLQFRYGLDTGLSASAHSAADYRMIRQHKFQVSQTLDAGFLQLDYSQKKEVPVLMGDVWSGHFLKHTLTKGAFCFGHFFSTHLKYLVNLKTAFSQKESSFLVQQRLSLECGVWQVALGYVRFSIPNNTLRLSVYEPSVSESFGFYTAYDDGDRWSLYVKQQLAHWFQLEFKLTQTHSFDTPELPKQLGLSLQMSVVL